MSNGNSVGQVPIGSNLFELIEFTLTRRQPQHPLVQEDQHTSGTEQADMPTLFGVNVAKVREVIRLPVLEPSLVNKPEVLGVFQLRGVPVPVIHLSAALGFSREPVSSSAQVIVTEFSGHVTGFVVAHARRIRRVSWKEVIPPQREMFGGVTGMILDEGGRFIFLLDFEKVLAELQGHDQGTSMGMHPAPAGTHAVAVADRLGATHNTSTQVRPVVLVVDDSVTARHALLDILGGFPCSVIECGDGEQAWQECLRLSLQSTPFMVISDVEMPRLDGYSFARRMKSDARFREIPFLLHSSLSGTANQERALSSGADAFIVKFNKRDLQAAVETCLSELINRVRMAS